MNVGWLSTALGSVAEEIYATTPFSALGLAVPGVSGGVRLEIRNRVAASSHTVAAADLPAAFRASNAGPAVHAVLASLQADRPLDRLLALWGWHSIVSTPIEPTGAVLWAASGSAAGQGHERDLLAGWSRRILDIAGAGEPPDVREARLSRVDALSAALPALGAALDVRTIFADLSAIARGVLPHDSAIVGIHTADRRHIRLHALSTPRSWRVPELVENQYPDGFGLPWDFAIHYDLSAHPLERDGRGARAGLRSALRLPIVLAGDVDNVGRIQAVLDFSAFAPRRYSDADLPIARRFADYVMLALSHQRLADEVRSAEELRVRASHIEMIDGLLTTLAGVLDVRDVFDRVSAISEKVMLHDAMSISMPSSGGDRLTIHVATGALGHLATPFDMPVPTGRLAAEHDGQWDFELVADLSEDPDFRGTPAADAGLRAMLSLPVRIEGQLRAAVNFFSRTPGQFTDDDVLVGRRIAEHIALTLSHQRLAEEAQRTIELRARAARVELVDHLLATLDAASVPDAFDEISAIARQVVTHDIILLPLALPDGTHARLYARGGAGAEQFPEIVKIPDMILANKSSEYELVDDLQVQPGHRFLEAAKRGYRSALRVPIQVEGRYAGALIFFAFAANAYGSEDVLVARRIADRVSLLMGREEGHEAARRAEEAEARASQLESRVRALSDELDSRTGYRRVVGESAAWRQVLTQATQVAETETTVLLLGESGTGKEVVARFLHRATFLHGRPGRPGRNDGADAPFVALNCAALPEQLVEAELFGYERGAFTGAVQSKPGQLEQAAGGMLFLDEVGEMSLPAQAKFLRVLQEREFQRLGGTRTLRTDARIVAATNRDLLRAMKQGRFREDLFYRLNVFAIQLPPLRERREDIVPLSSAFLIEIGRGLGRPPAGLSRDAKTMLMEYDWPGNVRELRNILERAAILCDGGLIAGDHLALLPAPRPAPVPSAAAVRPTSAALPLPAGGELQAMERAAIHQALEQARFNKSKAAKALGLTRGQLYLRMRRYGLA